MNWESAKKVIEGNIKKGADLNTSRSKYRRVEDITEDGLIVAIGEKARVNVSWEMLEACYKDLCTENKYNRSTLRQLFSNELNAHGCYVHVIGMIFVHSGLALKDGTRVYRASNIVLNDKRAV